MGTKRPLTEIRIQIKRIVRGVERCKCVRAGIARPWDDPEFRRTIQLYIAQRHPGWNLYGYAKITKEV
jgi:hypothetical protein